MTKKEILERLEAHVQESLAIRKIVYEELTKDCNHCIMADAVNTCSFDELKTIVDECMPNDKKAIKDLTMGEKFINPDSEQVLQFIELESVHNGKYFVVDVCTDDNELKTYLFNSKLEVEII